MPFNHPAFDGVKAYVKRNTHPAASAIESLQRLEDADREAREFEASEHQKQSLRDLRRWHWNGVLYNRTAQQRHAAKGRHEQAQRRGRTADFHMKAVQTLNAYFAVGDNAEDDKDPNN